MFHTCLPAAARPTTLRAPAAKARRGKRHFTVDIHAHLFSIEADALTKPHFKPSDETFLVFSNEATREVNRKQEARIHDQVRLPEPRLIDMDARGIDIQVISPSPHQYHYWAEPELGRQAAQLCNDRIAEVVGQHPDRFAGLGTVPLQAPEMAIAELERCVKQLGFRGVEIGTNVRGGELSDARLRPFWAKAQELGVLVFMHPAGTTEGRRLAEHYFVNLIGNPLESTLAVSHLIFGGVLDAYPRLKICVAHGGGYLASYPGRFDHAHAARSDCRLLIKKRPSTYLKKLYFDTLVFTPEQLEHLVRLYGSDHVLLGTDYPFDMGDEDPVGFIASATRLTGADRAAIMGLNAAKLLKIRVPMAKKPVRKRGSN
jgi:aminocarboxymuconate-semialdehyde decarboxylase